MEPDPAGVEDNRKAVEWPSNTQGAYPETPGDDIGNHGFVYSIATGTYQTVDDPNAVLADGGTTINGINDKGQLVGFYGTGDP
jgi:hypothetical protein